MMRYFQRILFSIVFLGFSTAVYAVEQIEVQGLFPGKAVLLIDGKMHVLATGSISPEGVKVISADSRSAVLEFNGVQKTYQLGNTIHTNFKKPEFLREQIFANSQGMYLTHGTINGRQAKFLIDTGASIVAINSITAKRLGINYEKEGKPIRAATASGVADGWG
ncbi:MAG: retroviral-like aspartic protease family protein, partial [Gammaproteobacteria bacterium]|nr:retroviral-like aspartic protease family protein [Gammaproteobacteria bacterium]